MLIFSFHNHENMTDFKHVTNSVALYEAIYDAGPISYP
jgi:hypothetical protein